MRRIYARIPAHFYRISLHTDDDDMTLALVPDQTYASLIARLLSENYPLRKGDSIIVAPTVLRPASVLQTPQLEFAYK